MRAAAGFSAPSGAFRTVNHSDQDQADIRLEFARLKQEHADFDAAINAMMATGCDPLQIQRMKKKKLSLKDRLQELEDQIIPDIIA
ncbi:YdcH family protein [Nitratireductor sp. CH_MIT9313-5]|uniref:YdcH family protein n=1 Tax=Nitratireductor sp. CH_MIT9313-5 TaxID=3107764 RepID=UPI00300B70C9